MAVGAASRDVAPDDPRGWRLGGSAAYCSLALGRLGLRVGCLLGVDSEAAGAAELDLLREAGVLLRLAPLENGPVFENVERDGHRRQRWLSRSDAVAASALPHEWRGARVWLLVPVAGEVGQEWAAVPGSADGDGIAALTAVGWQGMLREFRDDGWVWPVAPAPSALLRRADVLCASVDDLPRDAELGVLRGLAPAATLILTAGENGGTAFRGDVARRYRAVPAAHGVADPTGAGDTFLAGLIAAWSLTGELATARALRFAAGAASCVVEDRGLAGVPTRAQVAARLRKASAGGQELVARP